MRHKGAVICTVSGQRVVWPHKLDYMDKRIKCIHIVCNEARDAAIVCDLSFISYGNRCYSRMPELRN